MNKKKRNSPEDAKGNQNQDLPYDPELNSEDRQALPDEGLSMNLEEDRDRFLAERDRPVDFTAEDLDIPEKDLEVGKDGEGIPDEENQQFSNRAARPKKSKNIEPETDNPI